MSALRKAGVWLGLVEEDDDRHDDGAFDDDFADDEDDYVATARTRTLARPRSSERGHDRGSERAHDRDDRAHLRDRDLRERDLRERTPEPRTPEPRGETRSSLFDRGNRVAEPESRSMDRVGDRLGDRSESRGPDARMSDRTGVRQLARPSSNAINFPTQDNLALAPQVQLSERAVVADDKTGRYQITTLHPTTYSEARTIGEHFRDGVPVIMNLTEMDEADAKRLVDFAAGLAFGMRGSMERVTNRVFLISPPNIQVSAEDKARIAQGGFFDQA